MEFEKIKDIIARVLNIESDEITLDKSFADDLDADSLDLAEIIIAIEDEFGVTVPDEMLEKILTVQDACDFVKNWLDEH